MNSRHPSPRRVKPGAWRQAPGSSPWHHLPGSRCSGPLHFHRVPKTQISTKFAWLESSDRCLGHWDI